MTERDISGNEDREQSSLGSAVPSQRTALVMTMFGLAEVHGPFADDFTSLNWQYTEHWSGEWARYRAAGLEAFVRDYDGDDSHWHLKDVRTGMDIANGSDRGWKPPHFFKCLADAEAALKTEARKRLAALSTRAVRPGPSFPQSSPEAGGDSITPSKER